MGSSASGRTMGKPLTQFAVLMRDELRARDISVQFFADSVGISYEYARKLSVGKSLPSQRLLHDICKVLKLDEEETWKIVVSDRLMSKYGNIPMELAGKNPRFSQIERMLPKLSKREFVVVESTIKGILENKRAQ